MAGIRTFWVNVILITLVAFCFLMFTNGFVSKNNPNAPLLTDSIFANTTSSLNNSLVDLQSLQNKQTNALQNDTGPSKISIFLILDSVLTVGKAIGFGLSASYQVVAGIVFDRLFGGNYAIVSIVFLAIVAITIVLLVLKFVKIGETER